MLPLAVAATLGFRFAPLLYDGLGNRALPAIAALAALLLTPIVPLCVDFWAFAVGARWSSSGFRLL